MKEFNEFMTPVEEGVDKKFINKMKKIVSNVNKQLMKAQSDLISTTIEMAKAVEKSDPDEYDGLADEVRFDINKLKEETGYRIKDIEREFTKFIKAVDPLL